MANTDAPLGLRPVRVNPRVRSYLADGSGTAIFRGDIVRFDTSTSKAIKFTATTPDSHILGVAAAYCNVDDYLFVYDDPEEIFEVQGDGASDVDTIAQIGQYGTVVQGSGDGTTYVSGVEVDSSSLTATHDFTAHVIQIYDVVKTQTNDPVLAHPKMQVKFCQHIWGVFSSAVNAINKYGDATNYMQVSATGDISFAGSARIDWTKITANGVSIRNAHGTTSDTVSDLQTAHDGDFYTLAEESDETPGMDVEIDFTGVTAFNWVQILARYEQATAGHGITVMLEITPFNGSTWHRYGFFADQAANLTNENHSFFVPDDAAYINSGVVKVRLVHEMAGTSANHDLVIDTVALYQ